MHRPSGLAPLPLPALPAHQQAPRPAIEEDFCLPITASAHPVRSHNELANGISAARRPTPERSRDQPTVLHALDHGEGQDFPSSRGYLRPRYRLPAFEPFQLEPFAAVKTPWSVNSVLDLFRLFLPELSVAVALMTACGFMAGKLLARWTDGIRPLWVMGLYLTILTLYLGIVYLGGKGNNSTGLKASLRALVLGLLFLLIPHMVAFLVLTMKA